MLLRLIAASSLSLIACAALAEDVTVKVTARDCAKLVKHNPSANVAYQPGVDVKGRKVAPADMEGSGATMKVLPDTLEIPISISPFTWSAAPVGGLSETTSTVGTVKYDTRRGTFTYNDQPMGSQQQQAMADACAKRGAK